MQREKNRKNRTPSKNGGHFKKCNIGIIRIPESKENRARGIFEVIMAENISKLKIPNDRSKRLREHLAGKIQKTKQHRHLLFSLQKTKDQ